MSRPYTKEEVRKQLLDHIRTLVWYWLNESRTPSTRGKLEGLAFSILVTLDGESDLPKFIVAPDPHPDDKQFHINEGENYFPENRAVEVNCDLAGSLHEFFHKPR